MTVAEFSHKEKWTLSITTTKEHRDRHKKHTTKILRTTEMVNTGMNLPNLHGEAFYETGYERHPNMKNGVR